MEGEAHWLTGAVILGGIVWLGLLLYFSSRAGKYVVTSWRRVTCPETGAVATCLLVKDSRYPPWMDVESCSALEAPEQVMCPRSCISALNASAASSTKGGSLAGGIAHG